MSFSPIDEFYFDFWRYLFFKPWFGLLVWGSIFSASLYLVIRPGSIWGLIGALGRRFVNTGNDAPTSGILGPGRSNARRSGAAASSAVILTKIVIAYIALISFGGAATSAITLANELVFDPKPLSITLINDSDQFVFVRHQSHACESGHSSFFDDSIAVGDPRLRFHVPPDGRDSVFVGSSNGARSTSSCQRIGAINAAGTVLMLRSFTNREMSSMNWRIKFD